MGLRLRRLVAVALMCVKCRWGGAMVAGWAGWQVLGPVRRRPGRRKQKTPASRGFCLQPGLVVALATLGGARRGLKHFS